MSQGLSASTRTALVEYRLLDGEIHVFRFLSNRRQSVDDYFALLNQIILTAPPDEVFCSVVDHRDQEMPPLQYYYQAGLNWVQQHPNLPPLRTAYLTDFSPMTPLADTFVSLIQRTTRIDWAWRFMVQESIEDAARWLYHG